MIGCGSYAATRTCAKRAESVRRRERRQRSVAAFDRSVRLYRLPNKSAPSPGFLVTDLVPSSFFTHPNHHGRRVFDPTLSGKSPAQWYASARVAGLSIEDLEIAWTPLNPLRKPALDDGTPLIGFVL